jgi:hypothetical protein
MPHTSRARARKRPRKSVVRIMIARSEWYLDVGEALLVSDKGR